MDIVVHPDLNWMDIIGYVPSNYGEHVHFFKTLNYMFSDCIKQGCSIANIH